MIWDVQENSYRKFNFLRVVTRPRILQPYIQISLVTEETDQLDNESLARNEIEVCNHIYIYFRTVCAKSCNRSISIVF